MVLVRHDVRPVLLRKLSEPQSRRLPREIKGYWPRFIATALADDWGRCCLCPAGPMPKKLARQLSQQLPNQDPLVLTDESAAGTTTACCRAG